MGSHINHPSMLKHFLIITLLHEPRNKTSQNVREVKYFFQVSRFPPHLRQLSSCFILFITAILKLNENAVTKLNLADYGFPVTSSICCISSNKLVLRYDADHQSNSCILTSLYSLKQVISIIRQLFSIIMYMYYVKNFNNYHISHFMKAW